MFQAKFWYIDCTDYNGAMFGTMLRVTRVVSHWSDKYIHASLQDDLRRRAYCAKNELFLNDFEVLFCVYWLVSAFKFHYSACTIDPFPQILYACITYCCIYSGNNCRWLLVACAS